MILLFRLFVTLILQVYNPKKINDKTITYFWLHLYIRQNIYFITFSWKRIRNKSFYIPKLLSYTKLLLIWLYNWCNIFVLIYFTCLIWNISKIWALSIVFKFCFKYFTSNSTEYFILSFIFIKCLLMLSLVVLLVISSTYYFDLYF